MIFEASEFEFKAPLIISRARRQHPTCMHEKPTLSDWLFMHRTDWRDLKPSIHAFLDECRHPQQHLITMQGLMQELGMVPAQRQTMLVTA